MTIKIAIHGSHFFLILFAVGCFPVMFVLIGVSEVYKGRIIGSAYQVTEFQSVYLLGQIC